MSHDYNEPGKMPLTQHRESLSDRLERKAQEALERARRKRVEQIQAQWEQRIVKETRGEPTAASDQEAKFNVEATGERTAEIVRDASLNRDAQYNVHLAIGSRNQDNWASRVDCQVTTANTKRQIREFDVKQRVAAEREQTALKRAEKQAQCLAEIIIGCIVTILEVDSEDEICFLLAPPYHIGDVHPEAGKDVTCERLSVNSVLGTVLHGKFVGDEVEVHAPAGTFTYRVLSVEISEAFQQEDSQASRMQQNETERSATHSGIGSDTFSYLARDNGQFGSFASHDDYGDESDPEAHDNDWCDTNYE